MQDELLWAASWLHLASPEKKDVYLSYIGSNGHALGAEQDDFTFSWDDKRVATKVLLSKALSEIRFIVSLMLMNLQN